MTVVLASSGGSDHARSAVLSRTILLVDDEDNVRSLLGRWLESAGFDVEMAPSVDAALETFQRRPPAVMLCDIRMPGRDGLWLAGRVRQEYPETAVIMASGVQEAEATVECMRHGVVDYLTKPFGRDRLRDAVERGFEWHRGACEARRWRETLEEEIAERKAALLATISTMSIAADEDIETLLSAALDARDAHGHAHRVRFLAVATARRLGLDEAEIGVLSRAALLHDLGKAALPHAMLRKPAALTTEELALTRMYPLLGEELLAGVPYLQSAAAIVRDAHERMDGNGYPHGVAADTVSQSARILGVADVYDTITHSRVFRDAITPAEALLEIDRCSGSQFDPSVVAAFHTIVPKA